MIFNLNLLAEKINSTAHKLGWYDNGERNFGEVIALMHSELSEALEEWRNGNGLDVVYFEEVEGSRLRKPEGVPVELADCLIRILDTMHEIGVDIEYVVGQKMAYNNNRPYRHGGKLA